MRYITAAAVGALMSAGAAQAAVVDLGHDDVTLTSLTHTMTLRAADVFFENPVAGSPSAGEWPHFTYPGTPVGETEFPYDNCCCGSSMGVGLPRIVGLSRV